MSERLKILKELELLGTKDKYFGSSINPLLISVRSGATFSMPGMMDTILNVGLNGETTEGLARTTGDAMFAQRKLSLQIIEAGGDYVWTVKDNQATLRQDIELLFQPEKTVKGFSAGVTDFRTAQTIVKNHGRLERRTLTVSAELKEHLD